MHVSHGNKSVEKWKCRIDQSHGIRAHSHKEWLGLVAFWHSNDKIHFKIH